MLVIDLLLYIKGAIDSEKEYKIQENTIDESCRKTFKQTVG